MSCRSIFTLLCLLAFVACWPLSARAQYGSVGVNDVRKVARVGPTYLTAGITYTFETKDLAGSAPDTVIHLWDDMNDVQVAWDDDGGVGVASKIVYTPTISGYFTLFLRGYQGTTHGTCDLYQNGVRIWDDMVFGGTLVEKSQLVQPTDTVHTALVPGGLEDTVLYGLDGSRNIRVINDDHLGFASRITAPVTLKWILVSSYSSSQVGNTRLIINDIQNDADQDGLGGQLEAAICTCDTLSGSPCGMPCYTGVVNPQDSDGDGIRDDYEVLGRHSSGSPDFPQHLPKWGANPLRKDVFVEIDRTPAATALNLQMTQQELEKMVAPYDEAGTAGLVSNRDGSSGIKLHVDARTDPASPTDTRYGNWGGSNDLDEGEQSGLPSLEDFVASRRGIFRYVRGTTGKAGSALTGWIFAWAGLGDLGRSGGHELGHSLGLEHGGYDTTNAKPNYPSLMNYLYEEQSFSKGLFPSVNPTAMNEAAAFGVSDCADLQHLNSWGFVPTPTSGACAVDWNRDGTIASGTVAADPRLPARSVAAETLSPELGRYFQQNDLPAFDYAVPDAVATPGIARAHAHLYIGIVPWYGAVRLIYTPNRFFDHTDCPGNNILEGCATWSTLELTGAAPDTGAGPLLAASTASLLVVWVEGGYLKWQLLSSPANSHSILASGTVANVSGVINEPVLTRDAGDNPVVVFRTGDPAQVGPLQFVTFSNSQRTWSGPSTRSIGGQPLSARSVIAGGVAPHSSGYGTRSFVVTNEVVWSPPPSVSYWRPAMYEIAGTQATALNASLYAPGSANNPTTRRGALAFMPTSTGGRRCPARC
jgi:hypothetical protein